MISGYYDEERLEVASLLSSRKWQIEFAIRLTLFVFPQYLWLRQRHEATPIHVVLFSASWNSLCLFSTNGLEKAWNYIHSLLPSSKSVGWCGCRPERCSSVNPKRTIYNPLVMIGYCDCGWLSPGRTYEFLSMRTGYAAVVEDLITVSFLV